MAEIKFKDFDVDNLFDFCEVLSAIGIESVIGAFDKEDLLALQKSSKDERDIGIGVAMKVASILIKNITKSKEEICTFFANCMEWEDGSPVKASELKKFKISQFVKLIRDFSKKEDLVDFFKEVAEFVDMAQPASKNSATDVIAMPTGI